MFQKCKSGRAGLFAKISLCAGLVVVTATTGAPSGVQDDDTLRDRLIEIDRQIEAGPPRPRTGGPALALMYPEHMPLRDADRYREWLGVDDDDYRQWLEGPFAEYQQYALRQQEDLLAEARQLSVELVNEPGHNHTIDTYTPLIKRFNNVLQSYDRRLESAEVEAIAMLYAALPERGRDPRTLALIQADRQRLRHQTPCLIPTAVTDLIAVLAQMNIDAFEGSPLRDVVDSYVLEIGPARQKRFRDEMSTNLHELDVRRQRAGDPGFDLIAARRGMRRPYINSCMRLVRLNREYLEQFGGVLDDAQFAELKQRVREQAFSRELYDPEMQHRINIFTRQAREDLELDAEHRGVVDQFLSEFEFWYDEHLRKMERYIVDYKENLYLTLSATQADMIAHDAKMNSLKAEVHVKFQHMTTEITNYLGMN